MMSTTPDSLSSRVSDQTGLIEEQSTTSPMEQKCFNVAYERKEKQVEIVVGWVGLAVISGLICGALLAFLIFRFCFKRLWNEDVTEEQQRLIDEQRNESQRKNILWFLFPFCMKRPARRNRETVKSENKSTQMIGDQLISQKQSQHMEPQYSGAINTVSIAVGPEGMAEVLLSETPDVALAQHGEVEAENLENELISNRKTFSEVLTQMHLNQFSEGTDNDRKIIQSVTKKLTTMISETELSLENELASKLEEIRQNPEIFGDKEQFTEATDKAKAEIRQKRHTLFKQSLDDLRQILKDNTKLSESQIDNLINEISRNLAELERILNDHLDLQTELLHNRVAERHLYIEELGYVEETMNNQVNDLGGAAERTLTQTTLSDSIQKHVSQEFKSALNKANENHKSQVKEQMAETATKMKKIRAEKILKLQEQQKQEMEQLLAEAVNTGDPAKFLESVHALMTRHAEETAKLWSEIDRNESGKLAQTYLKLDHFWKEAVKKETTNLMDKIGEKEGTSQTEIKAIQRQHEYEVTERDRIREMDKKVKNSTMKDKLEERRKSIQSQLARQDVACQKVNDSQDDVLQRVLDVQTNLDANDRNQIMLEHEHNRHVLNNLIKLAQLKQDRQLERKLAERRVSLLANVERAKILEHETTEELNRFLAEQVENEKKEIEKERAKLVRDLRDQFANETKAILDNQDASMAEVIGRLQVGQARREAYIERQNKLVKRLESIRKMELELQEKGKEIESVDGNQIDQLLANHRQQAELVNRRLDEARQKQMENLRNKLENKRLARRKSLETKFEEEEQEMLNESMKSRMSLASTMLHQNKLKGRQQKALDRLEIQARAEHQRHRERLNRDLQKEMEKGLLEQRQQFLSQLASIIKMDPKTLAKDIKTIREQDFVIDESSTSNTNRLPPIRSHMAQMDNNDESVSQSSFQTRRRRKKKRRIAAQHADIEIID